VVLLGVLGAAVLLGMARLAWQRWGSSGEERSVDGYHQALRTLQGLASRNGGTAEGAAEVVPGRGASSPGTASPLRVRRPPARGAVPNPSGWPWAGTALPDTGGAPLGKTGWSATKPRDPARREGPGEATRPVVLVFDDLGPAPVVPEGAGAGSGPAPAWSAPVPASAVAPSGTGAGGSSNAARRRLLPGLVGGLALCVLGLSVATVVLALQRPRTTQVVSAPRTAGSRAGDGAARTAGRGGARGGATRGGSSQTGAGDRTGALQPATASADAATVLVPTASYRVRVSVSGICWVEGLETTSGTDVWSGILQAGQQHTFHFQGPVLLRMGAADASVTVDGHPLTLPAGHHAPYEVTFEPSAD
jgi:hypothetical protein